MFSQVRYSESPEPPISYCCTKDISSFSLSLVHMQPGSRNNHKMQRKGPALHW